MAGRQETVEGFVVDIACLRKYSPDEWPRLGPVHTKRCCLMGHCVESGYGLVTDDGRVALLDPAATEDVVRCLRDSRSDEGIRLQVRREERDGEMQTVSAREV
jgi:hypothetical protein